MSGTFNGDFSERERFYVGDYFESIQLSAMQQEPLLTSSVTVDRFLANASYEQIIDRGNGPRRSSERFAEVTPSDFTYKRRSVYPVRWSDHKWYDEEDFLRSQNFLMPGGPFETAVMAGFNTVMDQVTSAAFGADVFDVDGAAHTETTLAYHEDNGSTIGWDFEEGAYGSGLTVEKMQRASTILTENRVPNAEERCLAVHPRTLEQLMLSKTSSGEVDPRPVSIEYNALRPLVENRMGYYGGFMFYVSPDVGTGGGSYETAGDEGDIWNEAKAANPSGGATSTGRYAWAYTRPAVKLYVKPMRVSATIRPDLEEVRQISHYMNLDAKRLHGERMVRIACESTVAHS